MITIAEALKYSHVFYRSGFFFVGSLNLLEDVMNNKIDIPELKLINFQVFTVFDLSSFFFG